ncbi:MAG: ABC transporter substrate-binding protein [Synergistaceae bacterium]|nr:ABC transporter substrate-binding protein [Synergistaceae bacterium]
MNDRPVAIARELIRTYGLQLLEDPERLGQLLEDRCPDGRHEIFVLCFALRELSRGGGLPSADEFSSDQERAMDRLRDNLGFTRSAAVWAVYAIDEILDSAKAWDAPPDGPVEARSGFLRKIDGALAKRPRTSGMRRKTLRNGLLLLGIIALFLWLFVRITESRYPMSDEHRVLFLAHMSGADAASGHVRLKAAQLAADQINGQGGVKGRMLRISGRDIPEDPADAAASFAGLVRDNRVNAVISAAGSEVNMALAEAADELEIPLIITESSLSGVTMAAGDRPRLYSFRMNYDNLYMGRLGAYFISRGLGRRKVAVISNADDHDSMEIRDSFADFSGEFGLEITCEVHYTRRGALDLASASEVISSGAEAVFISNRAPDVAAVIIMLRRSGYGGTIVGTAYSDSLPAASGPSIDDSWWIVPASPDDTQLLSFQTSYRDKYNESISGEDFAGTLLSYDSVRWIADALFRAQGFQGEALRHALLSTRNLPLSHATLSIDPRNHSPWNKAASVVYCSDGQGKFQKRFRPR